MVTSVSPQAYVVGSRSRPFSVPSPRCLFYFYYFYYYYFHPIFFSPPSFPQGDGGSGGVVPNTLSTCRCSIDTAYTTYMYKSTTHYRYPSCSTYLRTLPTASLLHAKCTHTHTHSHTLTHPPCQRHTRSCVVARRGISSRLLKPSCKPVQCADSGDFSQTRLPQAVSTLGTKPIIDHRTAVPG